MTTPEPAYDYCEIRFQYTDDIRIWYPPQGWIRFLAVADGPNGRYLAAETPKVPISRVIGSSTQPDRSNPTHQSLHQQIVEQLLADGWRKTGSKTEPWYRLTFRRPAHRAARPKPHSRLKRLLAQLLDNF